MAGDGSSLSKSDIEKIVAETIAKTMPVVISQAIAATGVAKASVNPIPTQTTSATPATESASASSSGGERFYAMVNKARLSKELLDFTKEAFSKSLTKESWKTLSENYPEVEGSEVLLGAPSMETGMKEDIRKKHGYNKTKEVFAFDEGLAEKQSSFLLTARPILAALSALDQMEEGDEDGEAAPDPDVIKGMLEDALVFLGNANVRLNSWRQRRFSEYLTDVGRRTLKEEIPVDRHLFPEQFHECIKSEHTHSTSNKKLISQPRSKPRFSGKTTFSPPPFRQQTNSGTGNTTWRKRKWSSYRSNSGSATGKRYRQTQQQQQQPQSNSANKS